MKKKLKTTDGKKNIKILPEVHEMLSKIKSGSWDNTFLNLMKRSDELKQIEQSAMIEIYKEKEVK